MCEEVKEMNDNLMEIKMAIAAFFTAMSAFLGWQGSGAAPLPVKAFGIRWGCSWS